MNIFVKCTENFSEAFENNKQVSAETEKPCQNVVTPFLMAFLPHVFDECSQLPRIVPTLSKLPLTNLMTLDEARSQSFLLLALQL